MPLPNTADFDASTNNPEGVGLVGWAVLMVWGLAVKSAHVLSLKPLGTLLFSSEWNPLRGEFGFLPFLAGTLWVVAMAAVQE